MTYNNLPRTLAAITLVCTAAIGLSGCVASAPGELGYLQAVLKSCPDQPLNSFALADGSATSSSEVIAAQHIAAIASVVERTAVCGGHLRVTAFATNSATVPIYDADINVPGATDNARLRQVPGVVEAAIAEVTAAYGPAVAALPNGGTDVTGLYRLAGEQAALRPESRLEVTILTDGLTNQGVNIDRALTREDATALAEQVTVPSLPGASISVIGIGRVTGDPLPSAFIDGLTYFYDALCARTGAEQCLSVTDGR